MRNKNLIVLGSFLALALILFVVARFAIKPEAPAPGSSAPALMADAKTPVPLAEAAVSDVTAPADTATPIYTAAAEATTSPEASGEQAIAYLVVTVNNTIYQPIPLTSDGSYTITQKDIGAVNVIHVTPDSVYMESSTCEGQDCVKQGTVSLENRRQRILGNMIICLPNRVSLELYTPEEVQALLSSTEANTP